MKNISILLGFMLCLLNLTGCLSVLTGSDGKSVNTPLFSVSGDVSDLVTTSLTRDIYVVLDSDTNYNNGFVQKLRFTNQQANPATPLNFGFNNVPQGTYYIRVFKDVDFSGNGAPPNGGDTSNTSASSAVVVTNTSLLVSIFLDITL
jgi:hypothetical protein